MKKIIRAMIIFTAFTVMCAGAVSCKNGNSSGGSSSVNMIDVDPANPDRGKDKHPTTLGNPITVGETVFTVNHAVDVGKTAVASGNLDGGKYIYMQYTITNNSENDFPVDYLRNFSINYGDTTREADVRAVVYAQNHIAGFQQDYIISPQSNYTGYIGFIIPTDTQEFTLNYYVTADTKDTTSVILCTITPADYIAPPAGMLQ